MKAKIYSGTLFISLSLLFFSCGSEVKKNETTNTQPNNSTNVQAAANKVNTGLTESVKCSRDTSFSYSLYIPLNYDAAKQFPLMIFCDPHAKGLLPVRKYKTLADKYGFIFAGSYNSKNGQSQELGMQAIEMIINDLKSTTNIYYKRIYTSGFSGGARVAAAEALLRGGIAGVIGCGAGFPALDKLPPNKFRYITIVGNEDFNYSELYQLDKDLDQINFPRQFLVFNGKHEWCPVEVMDEALKLQTLYAMQDGILAKNDSVIKSEFENSKNKVAELVKRSKYEAFIELAKTIKAFKGLIDVSEQVTMFAELKKSAAVKNASAEFEDFFKAEQSLRSGYMNEMATKDEAWWKEQIAKMRSDIKARPGAEANTLKRVLNYLSLAAFMNTSQLILQKQFDQAQQYWRIYSLVDPDNPDVYFLAAQMFALQSKQAEALAQLQKAADKNYTDVKNLESESSFKFLRDASEYMKVLDRVKENASKE